MRITIILMLFVLGGCKQAYWVMGDSLSYHPDSWANQINQARVYYPELPYMQVNAMPGMTLVQFDFPDHISGITGAGVILALGVNDMLFKVPPHAFETKLIEVIGQAEQQNIEVDCILVPVVPNQPELSPEPYRDAQRRHCHRVIDAPLQLKGSHDGLHMSTEGNARYAIQILEGL